MFGQKAYFVYYRFNLFYPVRVVFIQMEIIKAFGNYIFDGGALVKRGRGVLENHLHVSYYFPVERVGNFAGYSHALIEYFACRAGIYPYYSAADGGFTRAALAYERERFALIYVERGVLYGFYGLVALAEGDIDVFNGEQNLPSLFVDRPLFGKMRSRIAQLLFFRLFFRGGRV